MWSIQDIKRRGLAALKSNYVQCVIASLLLYLHIGFIAFMGRIGQQETADQANNRVNMAVESLPTKDQIFILGIALGFLVFIFLVSGLLRVLLFNPLDVGCYNFYKKNLEHPSTKASVVSDGFRQYWHVVVTMFLMYALIALFSILLIVPGIIKRYSYCMVPFVLKEHPELSARGVLKYSEQMMEGNKWRAFLFDLSFVGWMLIGYLTLNIGNVLFCTPYYTSALAALFEELENQQIQNGTSTDLGLA